MHQQVAEAESERELRDRLTQQGFLIYSIKPRSEAAKLGGGPSAMQTPISFARRATWSLSVP
jgi:type II secretory pathway component PulF